MSRNRHPRTAPARRTASAAVFAGAVIVVAAGISLWLSALVMLAAAVAGVGEAAAWGRR